MHQSYLARFIEALEWNLQQNFNAQETSTVLFVLQLYR